MTVVIILGQRFLLIGTAAGVLRLDETNVLGRPTDRFKMIEHFLHQQLAYVLADGQLQLRIVGLQHRQHEVGDDAFSRRNQVQSADAAQVRLDEA